MTKKITAISLLACLALSGACYANESAGAKPAGAATSDNTQEYSKAQIALYRSNQVGMLRKNDVVNYTFNRQGSLETPIDDKASIAIVDVDQDGKKNITVNFLTGENHIEMPMFEGFKQGNPILMVFLEHDVKQMNELTKGSTLYFRSRIRDGLATPSKSTVQATTITIDQQKVEATIVTVKPYVGLEEIDRFKQFEQKSYQFVISPHVPGGVYSIKTMTPGVDGSPVLEESLVYASRTNS